ncbi:MAG TPA: nucleotide exchange factor GrpE [Actinomycetes bacterium]|nr:nucleotide exchange factor GrpE [Actinomycetes bacterium]
MSEFEERPVFRDKRRIDPQTYAVREPAPSESPNAEQAPPSASGDGAPSPSAVAGVAEETTEEVAAEVGDELAELTADLQRLSAEYANYRRRVERDRAVVRESAVAGVVLELLPVLDDIGRARDHGELEGAFRVVGESLELTVAKLGFERFAEPGEAFDPTLHEALTAVDSVEVDVPTVLEVYQPGYRYAGRVVRPARVVVAQPTTVDVPPTAHP